MIGAFFYHKVPHDVDETSCDKLLRESVLVKLNKLIGAI
jgi:hypothetical protein